MCVCIYIYIYYVRAVTGKSGGWSWMLVNEGGGFTISVKICWHPLSSGYFEFSVALKSLWVRYLSDFPLSQIKHEVIL